MVHYKKLKMEEHKDDEKEQKIVVIGPNKKEVPPATPVTIDGIVYLTFPEALEYVGYNREKLHQRVVRNSRLIEIKRIGRYVFIPLSYLEEERQKSMDKETEVMFKELKRKGMGSKEILDAFKIFLEKEYAEKDIKKKE